MKKSIKRAFSLFLAVCLAVMAVPITASAAFSMASAEFRNVHSAILMGTSAEIQLSLVGKPYTGHVVKNDVVLVIDRSGSMDGKLEEMKVAAKKFVSDIDMNDHRVGIVAYDSSVSTCPLTTDVNVLNVFIDSLAIAGSTRMDLGIQAAGSLLTQKRDEATGSIVLMTDGQPDSSDMAIDAAQKAKGLDYMFYTVALTPTTDSAANIFLKKLATSDTDHYFVGDSSQLANVYAQIAKKIGQCNAKDVVATATISSDFEYVKGSGDSSIPCPVVSGNTLTWNIPQLSAGESVVSFKIRPKSATEIGSYTPCTGKVTYTDYTQNTQTINLNAPNLYIIENIGLTATAGNKLVDLKWNAIDGASKYRVCVFQNGALKKYVNVDGKLNTATVTSLLNGTEYGFWVQVYKDGKYNSEPDTSNLVYATPFAPVPKDETPANLKATPGNKKVDLTWSAVNGAEKYRVCVFKDGKLQKYLNVTGKETATVTSLINGTEYGFWVQVYKNAKYSKDPDTANLVLATPTAPVPKDETPANLKATAGDKKVDLTWDAVDGAEKYRVCVFQNGKLKKYLNVTGKESATVTSLKNGTEYGFWVQVYKDGKYSKDPDTANLVLATPKTAPVPEVAPNSLTAVPGNKKVDLTWDAVDGAEKYRVNVFKKGKLQKYVNVAATKTSATVTSLKNGTEYSFWVQVYKNGKYSAVPTDTTKLVKAVPFDNTPKPTAPQNVTVTPGNRSAVVKWDAVTGAEKYRVCVYKGEKIQKYVNVANTKTEATVSSLTNGVEYSFGVQTYMNGKYSEITDVNALPKATPKAVVVPTASPANISVTEGSKSVTITWDAVAGAEKYRICTYYSNGTIKKYNFTTTDTTYTVTSLLNGTEYGFWVQAYANGRYSDVPDASQLIYVTPHA